MSGAVREPDPRVERLVEQARYWQDMHTIDIPTDELRGLLLSAFEAGEAAAAARPCTCTGCRLEADGWVGTSSRGAIAMAMERQRQVDVEGYTPDHDASIPSVEFVYAGVAYALACDPDRPGDAWMYWPWALEGFKPDHADVPRNLERAGALLMAAYDRLPSRPSALPFGARPPSIGAIALPVRGEVG